MSAPRVTPITASWGVSPAAKALIPTSSRTYTEGTTVPDARAISSTTLSSRCSSRPWGARLIKRPPRRLATALPPSSSSECLARLETTTTSSTAAAIYGTQCQLTGSSILNSCWICCQIRSSTTLVIAISEITASTINSTSVRVRRLARA